MSLDYISKSIDKNIKWFFIFFFLMFLCFSSFLKRLYYGTHFRCAWEYEFLLSCEFYYYIRHAKESG